MIYFWYFLEIAFCLYQPMKLLYQLPKTGFLYSLYALTKIKMEVNVPDWS